MHAAALRLVAVSTLAIGRLLSRKPALLSAMERQHVAMGRALLSGLDEGLKQQLLPYIQRVIQGVGLPTVYVSHAQDEVNSVANAVMRLTQGTLGQPDSDTL